MKPKVTKKQLKTLFLAGYLEQIKRQTSQTITAIKTETDHVENKRRI